MLHQQQKNKKHVFILIENMRAILRANQNNLDNFFIRYVGKELEKADKVFNTYAEANQHGSMLASRQSRQQKPKGKEGLSILEVGTSHGVLEIALAENFMDQRGTLKKSYKLKIEDIISLYISDDEQTISHLTDNQQIEFIEGYIHFKNIIPEPQPFIASWVSFATSFFASQTPSKQGYDPIPSAQDAAVPQDEKQMLIPKKDK